MYQWLFCSACAMSFTSFVYVPHLAGDFTKQELLILSFVRRQCLCVRGQRGRPTLSQKATTLPESKQTVEAAAEVVSGPGPREEGIAQLGSHHLFYYHRS